MINRSEDKMKLMCKAFLLTGEYRRQHFMIIVRHLAINPLCVHAFCNTENIPILHLPYRHHFQG